MKNRSKVENARQPNSLISLIYFIAACTILVLLHSCSGVEPMIEEMKWRIVYRDNGSARYEEMLIFLRMSDGDGKDDLAKVTVRAQSDSLEWRISSDTWVVQETETGEWTALPPIIPAENNRFSNDLYTLTLYDLAGETDEITLRTDPDRPKPDELPWPEAHIENSILQLSNMPDSSQATLILRNIEGIAMLTKKAFDGESVNFDGVSNWEIWISMPEISSGYRLGLYSAFLGSFSG